MEIDNSNMRQVILDFPKQFREALEFTKDVEAKGRFKNIVICGVGGSALPANLLITTLTSEVERYRLTSEVKHAASLPIYVHRSYGLPAQVNNNSLIVCISYSGNTEEAVSSLEEAIKRNLKAATITTGGKLKSLAETNNLPLILVPATGIQPRCATGYLFTSLIKLLSNSGVIPDKSREFLEVAQKLKPLELETQGEDLAKNLVGKIPLVYASDKFKALARIWKIKFNENSKVLAFWNYFPELNHNELVGYTNLQGKFHVIILRDKDDHPRILKRMEITSNLIKSKGAEVTTMDIPEGGLLFKIFSTLILGDWASYYLALEYGVDPTPVVMVEDLKSKLKE